MKKYALLQPTLFLKPLNLWKIGFYFLNYMYIILGPLQGQSELPSLEGTWVWNQLHSKRQKEGFFFNFIRNLLGSKDYVT
jgi:hypothetical protein